MVGRLFLEGNKAVGTPFGHLYIVYRDGAGREFVIRGGPDGSFDIVTEDGLPMGTRPSVPPGSSRNSRLPADAVRKHGQIELDLDGRSAADL